MSSAPASPAAENGRSGVGSLQYTELADRLAVALDPELTRLAFTHRSYAYEHGGLPTNERLEFLGDSVLGVIITDALYRAHPDLPEGQLAKLRASIVNMHALAGVGTELGIGELLLLGRGEESSGGRQKASIVADAVEAMIGAVYLQHGTEVARRVVLAVFADLLVQAPRLGAGLDWKTSLQELSAGLGRGAPVYEIEESGPDHAKTFDAVVLVGGIALGTGSGHTKKEAEQRAAATAYQALQQEITAEVDGAAVAGVTIGTAGAEPADTVEPVEPAGA